MPPDGRTEYSENDVGATNGEILHNEKSVLEGADERQIKVVFFERKLGRSPVPFCPFR